MANMEHCRFENTAQDLDDCWEHIEDDDLSKEEEKARKKLIRICKQIALAFEDDEE